MLIVFIASGAFLIGGGIIYGAQWLEQNSNKF